MVFFTLPIRKYPRATVYIAHRHDIIQYYPGGMFAVDNRKDITVKTNVHGVNEAR